MISSSFVACLSCPFTPPHTPPRPPCAVLNRLWLAHPLSRMGIELYLHGAVVTQWLRPDGGEAVRLRGDATFESDAPIR